MVQGSRFSVQGRVQAVHGSGSAFTVQVQSSRFRFNVQGSPLRRRHERGAAGSALRRPAAGAGRRVHGGGGRSRWRSGSAPTPPSSPWSTPCCCGRCPTRDPDRLVMVWQDMTRARRAGAEWTTPGNFATWRGEPQLFESVAAVRGWQPTLTGLRRPGAAGRRAGLARVLRPCSASRRRAAGRSPQPTTRRWRARGDHLPRAVAAAVRRAIRR